MEERSGPGTSVILAVQRAAHATSHTLSAEMPDLTASEISALANLCDGPGRTVSWLATATGAPPSTLTGILDRLERRGYITRSNRAGDRRSVLISLTPAGHDAAREITMVISGVERRALAGLPGGAVTRFLAVLHALTEQAADEPG